MLHSFSDKMFNNQLQLNERRNLCTLLTDLMYFIDESLSSSSDSPMLLHHQTGNNERDAMILAELTDATSTQNHYSTGATSTVKEPNRERQKLMREQNILQQIFRILKAPFAEYGGKMGLSVGHLKDSRNGLQQVFRLCYRILKHSQESYRKNQVLIFTILIIFFKQY